ncbi:MAG: nucleotidyltransferase domain-containing protein [Gammaproteobacteria bacterium]|nr:nucleotidyltransferase domain-containing protein [Gammaproteobacteria bacterium]
MATLDHVFNKTQRRILTLIFNNPGESFYTNELIRMVDTGSNAVSKELKRFKQSGILTAEKRGNQVHYQANQNSPIYKELYSLIRKTFGISEPFKEALLPIKDKIERAFIYGSFASGTENAESDVDLMVVTDELKWEEIIDHVDHLSGELMRSINPTLYTTTEFSERLSSDHYFIRKVMDRPRIELV